METRERAAVAEAVDIFRERLAELNYEQGGEGELRLVLHVWSGPDYNEFYGLDSIDAALTDFHRRIDVGHHSRLYIEGIHGRGGLYTGLQQQGRWY